MKKWQCLICGFSYLADQGITARTGMKNEANTLPLNLMV